MDAHSPSQKLPDPRTRDVIRNELSDDMDIADPVAAALVAPLAQRVQRVRHGRAAALNHKDAVEAEDVVEVLL